MLFLQKKTMNPLISYIARKLPTAALVSTLVIFYPNIVCLCVDIVRTTDVASMQIVSLALYTLVKFLLFWGMFFVLIRYNLNHTTLPLNRRLAANLLMVSGVYAVNLAVYLLFKSYGAREDTGSVLVFQYLVTCFFSTVLGHFVKLYIEQRQKEMEIQRLKSENLQSRYDALMGQINPHFLFNSLGGISALIRKKDDNRTLRYVDELSDIFRYILQSERKGMVGLGEELQFVEAFRYVMEVRFEDKLSFDIRVDERAKNTYKLPALSLVPLIDMVVVHNQFDTDHKMLVSVSINGREDLVVSNPVYPRQTPAKSNGTGLRNLFNRFGLLTGKNIRKEHTETKFTVYLPLTK